MHRLAFIFGMICFILVGVGSYFGATKVVENYQSRTEEQLEKEVFLVGQDWASIKADGLQVRLSGLAPDEAARFAVLETIGKRVDPDRITDNISILVVNDIAAPKFKIEILRNEDRISLIGLVPTETGRDTILETIEDVTRNTKITDMLEEADHPTPENWRSSIEFGMDALERLPRSKISIGEDAVEVSAVTESQEEKSKFERLLKRNKPEAIDLTLHITAPRPVISPFILRYSLEDGSAELTSCSADTQLTKERILSVAKNLGVQREATCDIGLGVPTPDWANAVSQAMEAISDLGGGVVTFSDSDITLVSTQEASQPLYDDVIGRLENELPDLFSLSATLPPKPLIDGDGGEIFIPDFTATKSPEGLVQLRGRLPNISSRSMVETFAKSKFGADEIYMQTRLDENLPNGWPVRVLGGLEALSKLNNGSLIVQPDLITIKGVSIQKEAKGEISDILTVKLGGDSQFELDVNFDEKLATQFGPPTKERCEQDLEIVLQGEKILFAPGQVVIEESSLPLIKEISDVMRECSEFGFEIQGYTDNSGGEELNRNLSQSRANTIRSAILAQRVSVESIEAVGFGPDNPIADNSTEEGREANRRIEIKLKPSVENNINENSGSYITPTLEDQGATATNADDIKKDNEQ